MPLHNKIPFERRRPPKDLRDDEKVFYCAITKEIFRDYEEYCQRIILCNSLVWTCSYTGRPFLTFQEALKSEQNAMRNLKDFPMELKVPVLFLASKTHRTGILDLVEDIYIYVRDRYFVGETVEVCLTEGGAWTDAHIVQVIGPSEKQIAGYSPSKSEVKDTQRQFQPPASLFSYEVELLDCSSEDASELLTLPASQVRRKPRMYSRDRNRLFLKQFLEPDQDGILRVKESELSKYKIRQKRFDQIFTGNPPLFPSSRRAVKRLQQQQLLLSQGPKRKYTKRAKPDSPSQGKKSRQETIHKYITMTKRSPNSMNGDKPHSSTSPHKTMAQKVKDKYGKAGKIRKRRVFDNPHMREQLKIKAIEDKKKRREDLLKERAAKKEKKLELAKFIREWNKLREDLECEDLKSLPVPLPIKTRVPNKLFGDMVMVMEFLHTFSELLNVKNFFPNGMTLELMERALTEPEVAGPLCDVVQLLLSALFEMQEDEDDALADANPAELTERLTGGMDDADVATSEALRLATAAAAWCTTYQGVPLSKIELDAVNLSEVLRLHLLQSGGRAGEMSSEWRYRERGGYTTRDDPGLVWKMENPHILKALSTVSVFELPSEHKLSILTCLINQILTYVAVRDVIEERMEKTKQIRVELHFADREVSKKEKEMIERTKKRRKKHAAKESDDHKVNGGADESEAEEETQTPEEKAARLARERKTNSDKQRELQKRRNQLLDEMLGHTNLPIGCDRAHRRFWLFSCLPGLFVEHDERFAGSCLKKPTPHNWNLLKTDEDTLQYVCKLFEEERNGGSDKENDGDAEIPAMLIGSPNKKLLSEKNHLTSGSPLKTPQQQMSQADDLKQAANHAALLTCSANPDTCPVHSPHAERTTWAFYLKDQLDELINHLSVRGYRESELRSMLVQGKDRILHSLEYCPVSKLNPDEIDESQEVRKSQRQKETYTLKETLLGQSAGTPISDILELTLRDVILEMEEKISAGGLGSLKVKDRTAWREAMKSRSYSKECEMLSWPGLKEETEINGCISVDRIKSEHFSRPSTPDSTISGTRDPSGYTRLAAEVVNLGDSDVVPKYNAVRDLACALLQVSQGIDDRYLQKPLGLDAKEKEKLKEKLKKEEDMEESEKEKEKDFALTPLQKWQVSLMASTSFPQLFLHYATLDNSVLWSKSALNARCKVCRKRGDPDQMLLCDGCNKGYHMYCHKPKINNIPSGDWFCPTCKPKEKKQPTKKIRKVFDEDEENDDETSALASQEEDISSEPCKSCGKDGSEIQCGKCCKCFHLSCLEFRVRRTPKGKWMCEKCKSRVSNSRKAGDTSPGDRTLFSRRRCAARAIDNISRFAKQLRNMNGDDDEVETVHQEHEEVEDRHLFSRRRCAAKAVANISHYAKQLRNQSYDDNSSEEGYVSRRRSRRSLDGDGDELPLDNAALQELLEDIIRHKDSWAFTRPVLKSEVPDYHSIIKRPMDFGTIKHKLNMLEYRNTSEVLADALLVFENCDMYNQPDSEVYKSGVRLRKYFEKRCREKNLKYREEDVRQPEAKKKRIHS